MNAIYAGSFDPFTCGHYHIVEQAVDFFDKVYIVFANNQNKKRCYNIQSMIKAVQKDIDDKGWNCEVISSDILIVDLARKIDCKYLIRGIRNTSDYLYEENIAKINHEINYTIRTIYFRPYNEVLSSSMVKELYNYGKDISKYVTSNILEVIENENKH